MRNLLNRTGCLEISKSMKESYVRLDSVGDTNILYYQTREGDRISLTMNNRVLNGTEDIQEILSGFSKTVALLQDTRISGRL